MPYPISLVLPLVVVGLHCWLVQAPDTQSSSGDQRESSMVSPRSSLIKFVGERGQSSGTAAKRDLPAAGQSNNDRMANALLIGDACSSNDMCANIANSNCTSDLCRCNAGFVALARIACVAISNYFGDSCVISAQCQALDSSAICYKDRCLCEPHYYIAALQCPSSIGLDPYDFSHVVGIGTMPSAPTKIICHRKKTLGQPCCHTKQCAYNVWASECREHVCRCHDGFVPIGTHSCARKAIALGDACAVDSQCQDIGSSECKALGICWCNDKSTPSTSVAGRQNAAPECLPTVNLGASCTIDSQCTALNSQCTQLQCDCADGYVAVAALNVCLPQVDDLGGQECALSLQCTTPNSHCSRVSRRCECDATFCQQSTLSTTVEACTPFVGLGEACDASCQCSNIAGSAVCTFSTCACAATYVAFGSIACLPDVNNLDGDECSVSSQCTMPGTQCSSVTGKCECDAGSSLNATSGNCEDSTTGSGATSGSGSASGNDTTEALTLAFTSPRYLYGDQFCCRPDDYVYGFVAINPLSTDTAVPTFTEDSPDFSVDTSGAITLDAGKMLLSGSALFTVTATSGTLNTLTATTIVELRANAICCHESVTVFSRSDTTTITISVNIGDRDVSNNNMGCGGINEADKALNADNIIDISSLTIRDPDGATTSPLITVGNRNRLFQHPCDPTSNDGFSFSSATSLVGPCTFDETTGIIDWTGTSADLDGRTSRTCHFSSMVSDCSNGAGTLFNLYILFSEIPHC